MPGPAPGWLLAQRAGALVLGVALGAAVLGLGVPVALLAVAVVVLPYLAVFALARFLFWIAARVVAQLFPDRAAPEHRWHAWSTWLVAVGSGVLVAAATLHVQPLRLLYVQALAAPVSTVLPRPVTAAVSGLLCHALVPSADRCLGLSPAELSAPSPWRPYLDALAVLPALAARGARAIGIDAAAAGATVAGWLRAVHVPLTPDRFDVVFALALAAGLVLGTRKNETARRIALIDPHSPRRPAARRRAPAPPAGPAAPPPATGRSIVILCDGTANHPGQLSDGKLAPTNVSLLHQSLADEARSGWAQHTWYDPGVGTGTSSISIRARRLAGLARRLISALPASLADGVDRAFKVLEGATGVGIEENIQQGYLEIVRRYQPGDRIVLLGFSRGAYTARCIAGVIDRCGLLRRDFLRFGPDVITLYRRRTPGAKPPLVDPAYVHPAVSVHVLGLWDTVASLGLPLWGWWFRMGAFWQNLPLDTNPAQVCEHVYHALSMDERRAQFFPTLATPRPGGPPVEQVWFRGAHADVGGGYAEPDLADVSQRWMLDRLLAHGVQLGPPPAPPTRPAPNELGPVHDEIQRVPGWEALGSWPRWHPIARPGDDTPAARAVAERFGRLSDAAWSRAAHAGRLWHARLGRGAADPLIDAPMAAEGFVFLDVGDRVRVAVPAERQWTRTAVVIEQGAAYRISAEGQWRDAGKRPCGPDGQDAYGLDLARRLLAHGKRRRTARWMELLGHVAHPRDWPVFELGFFRLVRFLLVSDPAPLVWSLLRLGEHMWEDPVTHARAPVYLRQEGASGLFYAFPNDCWQTYANNSGAVTLTIERVASVPAGVPCLVVDARGKAQGETTAAPVATPAFSAIPPARGTVFGVPAAPAPPTVRVAVAVELAPPGPAAPAPVAFRTWDRDEL